MKSSLMHVSYTMMPLLMALFLITGGPPLLWSSPGGLLVDAASGYSTSFLPSAPSAINYGRALLSSSLNTDGSSSFHSLNSPDSVDVEQFLRDRSYSSLSNSASSELSAAAAADADVAESSSSTVRSVTSSSSSSSSSSESSSSSSSPGGAIGFFAVIAVPVPGPVGRKMLQSPQDVNLVGVFLDQLAQTLEVPRSAITACAFRGNGNTLQFDVVIDLSRASGRTMAEVLNVVSGIASGSIPVSTEFSYTVQADTIVTTSTNVLTQVVFFQSLAQSLATDTNLVLDFASAGLDQSKTFITSSGNNPPVPAESTAAPVASTPSPTPPPTSASTTTEPPVTTTTPAATTTTEPPPVITTTTLAATTTSEPPVITTTTPAASTTTVEPLVTTTTPAATTTTEPPVITTTTPAATTTTSANGNTATCTGGAGVSGQKVHIQHQFSEQLCAIVDGVSTSVGIDDVVFEANFIQNVGTVYGIFSMDTSQGPPTTSYTTFSSCVLGDYTATSGSESCQVTLQSNADDDSATATYVATDGTVTTMSVTFQLTDPANSNEGYTFSNLVASVVVVPPE